MMTCLLVFRVPWISFLYTSLAYAFYGINGHHIILTPHRKASKSCLDFHCQDRCLNFCSQRGHCQLLHCPVPKSSDHLVKPSSYNYCISNRTNSEGGTRWWMIDMEKQNQSSSFPSGAADGTQLSPVLLNLSSTTLILCKKTKRLLGLRSLSGTFSIFQSHSFDNAKAIKSYVP